MNKTTENNASINDICVDTPGLQKLTHSGRKTAIEIGIAAEAKIVVGRRILWNISKVRNYLDSISK